MSHTTVVARLALRELWISFRLLLLLVVFVGAGTVATMGGGGAGATLERFAIGLAVAVTLAAALAGWSMAEERSSGRAGWLVARSVGRGAVLGGWLGAFGITALGGLTAAAVLVWVAVAPFVPSMSTLAYAAAIAAVGAICLAALAAGLLLGGLLPVPLAASLAALVVGAAFGAAWLLPGVPESVHGAAVPLLARAAELPSLTGIALRAGGVGLGAAAAILVVARAVLDRAEL